MGTPRLKNLVARLKEALSGKEEVIPKGWISLKELQKELGIGPRQTRAIAWASVEKGILEHRYFKLFGKTGKKSNFSYFREVKK